MAGGHTIGIDLGTTNSVAAVMTGADPEVVPNDVGERTTPSVVAHTGTEWLVGKAAANQAAGNPEGTVTSIKRHMGDDDYAVTLDGEDYTPEELSALVLRKLVVAAENYLGGPVTNAVVTVPAYFSERQREATEMAGEIAGLTVDRIINEPTAACLAYGLDDPEAERLAMVYDLGGGTFDVSIVELGFGVVEVIATSGDTDLGGDDWDDRVVEWMVETFREQEGIDLTDDHDAMARLRDAAKDAKHDLSARESVDVRIPYVAPEADFEATLTRETFAELTADLVARTVDVCTELFDAEDTDPADIDTALLVGGSTRMPQVQAAVADFLGQDPAKEIHPDEAVALGAAVQAVIVAEGDDRGGTGEQAANLPSVADDLVLVDVTPRSIGVELADGTMDVLVERNETVPVSASKDTYTTARDNQDRIDVRVYQGEHPVAEENELLDTFTLEGIHPAPAGDPRIRLDFHLDESGILDVTATDLEREESESITITSAFRRSDDEIRALRDRLPDVE